MRCKAKGFLPLHDAAWGNAPAAVAVLLCAVYPAGALTRAHSGETPHALGQYHHHRTFAWPPPERLLELGRVLRANLQRLRVVVSVRTASAELMIASRQCLKTAVVAVLRLPSQAATSITDFLAAVPSLPVDRCVAPLGRPPAGQVSTSTSAVGAKWMLQRAVSTSAVVAKPQVQRRGRRLYLSGHLADLAEVEEVEEAVELEHLQEETPKDPGHYAGMRIVRHRRCGFTTVSKVAVGPLGVVHRLHLHVAHKVAKEVQKPRVDPKWPSKVVWRRDRCQDRMEKLDRIEIFQQQALLEC